MNIHSDTTFPYNLSNDINRYSVLFVIDKITHTILSDTVKPIFWPRPAYELDPSNPANNGFINQDFLVWMRRSALPNFRKLYRRITDGDYATGLPAGDYSLVIGYSILFNIYKKGCAIYHILVANISPSIYLMFWNIWGLCRMKT